MKAVKERTAPERLLLRGHAVGLCARILTGQPGIDEAEAELRDVLGRLGLSPALSGAEVAGRAATRGVVPVYETSYEPGPGASGGPTFQMADIAGFYRAFGFEVSGERPDHIVPELEFLALVLVKEAYALMAGQVEGAEICATARRRFIAEHLGRWLPMLRERARGAEGGEGLDDLAGIVLSLAEAED